MFLAGFFRGNSKNVILLVITLFPQDAPKVPHQDAPELRTQDAPRVHTQGTPQHIP